MSPCALSASDDMLLEARISESGKQMLTGRVGSVYSSAAIQ